METPKPKKKAEVPVEERPGYLIRRGAETKRFLESTFWRDHLGPWLLQRSVDLGQEALAASVPGRTLNDEVLQRTAKLGGKNEMITDIRTELKIWLDKAEEAHSKVERKLGRKG